MILIGIGSNLNSPFGPPETTVAAAVRALERHGIAIRAASSIWHTPPYPKSTQPWFSNAVVHGSSPLGPQDLLQRLHDVERRFSRKRRVKWAARPLDLDLLDYHGQSVGVDQAEQAHFSRPLILPHPSVGTRNFVLYPLREVAPRWRHPISGASVNSLIMGLPKAQLIAKGRTIQPI